MFQDIKLSTDVDIWAFLATFSKKGPKFYSIFWSHCFRGPNIRHNDIHYTDTQHKRQYLVSSSLVSKFYMLSVLSVLIIL
jgi:hypothetical protein